MKKSRVFGMIMMVAMVAVTMIFVGTPPTQAISEMMVSPECRRYVAVSVNAGENPLESVDVDAFLSAMAENVAGVELAKDFAAKKEVIAQAKIFRMGCVVFAGDVEWEQIVRILEYGWRLRFVEIFATGSLASFYSATIPTLFRSLKNTDCKSVPPGRKLPDDALEIITGRECLLLIKTPPSDLEIISPTFQFTFVRERPYLYLPLPESE